MQTERLIPLEEVCLPGRSAAAAWLQVSCR